MEEKSLKENQQALVVILDLAGRFGGDAGLGRRGKTRADR